VVEGPGLGHKPRIDDALHVARREELRQGALAELVGVFRANAGAQDADDHHDSVRRQDDMRVA
jgi:hypothetical protein